MIILITWTLFDTTEWGDEDDPDDHVETRLKSQQEKLIIFSRIAVWDFIRALHHFVQVCIFNYKLRHLNRLKWNSCVFVCVIISLAGKNLLSCMKITPGQNEIN